MSFQVLDYPLEYAGKEAVKAMPDRALLDQISYRSAAPNRRVKALIRTTEALGGRQRLLRRVAREGGDLVQGGDLWRSMLWRCGVSLDVFRGSLEDLPTSGPLVLVANHPYGMLDGLVLGSILSSLRKGDFKIVANSVFSQSSLVSKHLLPIDFAGSSDALETNLRSRRDAIAYLRAGGAIGIFPGGTVSTAARPFGTPRDPMWRGFTARMIHKSGATVVPIWFEGQNSRLFQVSSHVSYAVRLGLLLREFHARLDKPVRLAIGAPILPSDLRQFAGDAKQTMDFLRRKTYEMSPDPADATTLGFEFEERYRTQG